jgi:hypothetical protein
MEDMEVPLLYIYTLAMSVGIVVVVKLLEVFLDIHAPQLLRRQPMENVVRKFIAATSI